MSLEINLFSVVYLLLPAALANMMPVFFKNLNFLNYPVDFGLKFYGKRLFGENKTIRGILFGVFGAVIFVFLQRYVYDYPFFGSISLIDYGSLNLVFFGFLVGFSVLLGDLIGSFIKRRFNFEPGKSFFILDQINGGVGFALVIIPVYFRSWPLFFWVVSVWFIGHLVIKYVGYLLGIYKEKI